MTSLYAEITATPDASFNVATAECDICGALGVKKSADVVETYTNGVKNTAAETYTATATKAMVGAQGQQIEFYEVKDGYSPGRHRHLPCSRSTRSVEDEKTDAKGGHVTQRRLT